MANQRSTVAVAISVIAMPSARRLVVGVQRNQDVEQMSKTSGETVDFSILIDLIDTPDGIDFRGPYVHGRKGERFLYVCWGSIESDGEFQRIARTKLMLGDVETELLDSAKSGSTLEATVVATDDRGQLRTGRVRPPAVTWTD